MKKGQFKKVLWAIIVVTALAETVCGKKSVKRISKRLKVLDKMAEVEVWLEVYNTISSKENLSTGNSSFAHSPIVKRESRIILEKIKSKATTDINTLEERMKTIIERKLKGIQQLIKLQ